MTGSGALVEPAYPRHYVNEFNGFLMDICNLIWRARAFNTADTNALGCLLPPPVYLALRSYLDDSVAPPQSLLQLFSLSYHPALAALSIASFRDMEDRIIEAEERQDRMDVDGADRLRVRHAGPVGQRSLALLGPEGGIKLGWTEYRLEVLNWLAERGVGGVGELMFCTMKLLMTGKGSTSTPNASPG